MAKDWSAEETARIISEVKNPTCSNQELAKQLGRSAQSVAAKKRHLAGLAAEDQPAAEKKPGEKHTRGRRGRKSAQKVRQEAVTEVQETAAAAEAPAAAEEPAEKKSGERHSRGRRGRKSAQKAQQEPVTEAQETAASAEAPAAAEEPAEKKSGERHSRSRRGRKSAQKAQQEPQQAPAPQESTPEGKTQDAERAALAELERSFVIRQTAPAAETPAAAPAAPADSLPNIPGLSAVNAAGATPMHHAEPSKHIPGLAEAIGQSTGTPPAEKPIRKSIADFIRRD
jgi:hypothetical protein